MYQEAGRVGPRDPSVDGPLPHVIYHWGLRITDRAAWLDKVAEHDLTLEYGGENLSGFTTDFNWAN